LLNIQCLWVLLVVFAAQARPATRPREHFDHATVQYDWVVNQHGERLRTFLTRPIHASGKVPVLFVVGWLSCDSVEYPDPQTQDGFGILLRHLIEQSGYATIRMDKPGVGESQGTCVQADFQSELEGYQAAFDALSKHEFLDLQRVFVLGLSNGGGVSPLAARGHPVRGFISCGSWGRTWYEHMVDLNRSTEEAGHLGSMLISQ
jgi:pimeloyl-ACP methyl ester carboxylesterase